MAFYVQSPNPTDAVRKSPFRHCGEYKIAQADRNSPWWYVTDQIDFNCLAFSSVPGAKFTDKDSAQKIVTLWNT